MKAQFGDKSPTKREPVRSFQELADEIGIPVLNLASALGRDKQNGLPVPEQALNTKNSVVKNTYYRRREFLQWWKSREAA